MGEAGTAITVAKAARWAWDHQDQIDGTLKKFWRKTKGKIFSPEPQILILGPGGVGKSTLGRMLSGKYDHLLDGAGTYEQSVSVQTFRRSANPDVEVVVAPGQYSRRSATWPSLLRNLAGGKIRGVIFCCAYGYHALNNSPKYHELYRDKVPDAFLPAYLESRRKEEIAIMKTLEQAFTNCAKPIWLITFVGKQDLWCPHEPEVRAFYDQAEGDYACEIAKVFKAKGDGAFRHECVFGSLVINNFVTTQGDHLASNVAGYDYVKQVKSLRQVFETVAALEQWKS